MAIGASANSTNFILRVWKRQDHTLVRQYRAHHGSLLSFPSLAFSPDSQRLLSWLGNPPHTAFSDAAFDAPAVWDVATGQLVKRVDVPDLVWQYGALPSDRQHVLLVDTSNVVHWYSLTGSTGAATEFRVVGRPLVTACASADARRLATFDEGGSLALWDVAAGHAVERWTPGYGSVMSLSCQPDRIVAWGCFHDVGRAMQFPLHEPINTKE
jgi:hypothetical protein